MKRLISLKSLRQFHAFLLMVLVTGCCCNRGHESQAVANEERIKYLQQSITAHWKETDVLQKQNMKLLPMVDPEKREKVQALAEKEATKTYSDLEYIKLLEKLNVAAGNYEAAVGVRIRVYENSLRGPL